MAKERFPSHQTKRNLFHWAIALLLIASFGSIFDENNFPVGIIAFAAVWTLYFAESCAEHLRILANRTMKNSDGSHEGETNPYFAYLAKNPMPPVDRKPAVAHEGQRRSRS